jgi:hypothetical protein
LVDKKGLWHVQSYLIFQGISTLLELAPASRLTRDRLLWLPRASPSATLDKMTVFNLHEHDILCQEKIVFFFLFTHSDKIHKAMVELFFDPELLGHLAHLLDGYGIKVFGDALTRFPPDQLRYAV